MFDLTPTIRSISDTFAQANLVLSMSILTSLFLLAVALVITVLYHSDLSKMSYKTTSTWSKWLTITGILAFLPAIVSGIVLFAALNIAEDEVKVALQSWASEEYTINLTDDQVNMMIDRINLENPSDDVTGTLVIQNNGTEEPILWHFVNGNKIMLTDMDMNPLPAQDK